MVAHTTHIHKKIKNEEDLGGVACGPGTCKTEEKGLVQDRASLRRYTGHKFKHIQGKMRCCISKINNNK